MCSWSVMWPVTGSKPAYLTVFAISWGKKAQYRPFLSDSGETRKMRCIEAAAEMQKETRTQGCGLRTVLIMKVLTVTLPIQSNLKPCRTTHHADEVHGTTGIPQEHFEEKLAVTNDLTDKDISVRFWLVGKNRRKTLFSQKPQTTYLSGMTETQPEGTHQPLAVRPQLICILWSCILKCCENWNEIFIRFNLKSHPRDSAFNS